jgi:hypothetical protein
VILSSDTCGSAAPIDSEFDLGAPADQDPLHPKVDGTRPPRGERFGDQYEKSDLPKLCRHGQPPGLAYRGNDRHPSRKENTLLAPKRSVIDSIAILRRRFPGALVCTTCARMIASTPTGYAPSSSHLIRSPTMSAPAVDST